MEFKATEASVSASDITRFEQEFDVTLPADYKSNLLMNNGGYPVRREIEVNDEIVIGIKKLYPLKYTKNNLEIATKRFWNNREIDFARSFIPFGYDPGGDNFLICIRKNDYGAVYIWRHDFFLDDDKGLLFLSSSFSTFLDSLR